MKVLVAGANGMLGHDLIPALRLAGHLAVSSGVLASDDPDFVSMDITDLAQVREVFAAVRPDALINCAAFTNVDGAESDVDGAYRINALGSWNLALACQEADIPLMYVSTDYVFDGARGSAYDEYDTPNPQGVYGRSKRAGEIHVERLCPRHYIVRTSWLYGHGGKNFVETIIKAASERPELRVVNDQWGTPTPTVELARTMCRLLETGRYGTYHASGEGACTWFDFAAEIVAQAGLQTPVLPQSTQESARPAPRPAYSVMDNLALRLAGLPSHLPWQEALKHYMSARPAPSALR
ncbi:MAG TPA: dTDP-4-dehydrorhamnose reductase [Pantanalinema sp.]